MYIIIYFSKLCILFKKYFKPANKYPSIQAPVKNPKIGIK